MTIVSYRPEFWANFVRDQQAMKNILLPTDFSETSMKAATFALDLFGTEGVNYMLLNTYLKPAYRNALIPLNLDTERASRNGLRRMERRCRKHAGTVRIALRSSFEQVVQAANDLDAAKAVDFVVMGTQGEGNYGQVGRNANSMVTSANPPVIAVPSQWQPAPIAHILFADDGQGVTRASIEPLLDIAQRTGAHVTVLYVGLTSDDSRTKEHFQKLSTSLGKIPHSFTSVEAHAVTEVMDRMVVEKDIQLVAVLRRKRSFWERIFQGSTSKRMALHTTVPLLVLREN